MEGMCTLHQGMGEEEENGVKANSAADDNSQKSAAAAELFRKINDFFNPMQVDLNKKGNW